MKKQRYKARTTIVHDKVGAIKPGNFVTPDMFGKDDWNGLIKRRDVIACGAAYQDYEPTEKAAVVKSVEDEETGISRPVVEAVDEVVPYAPGKWNFDPEALKDKSLEDLNLLIQEHDDNVAPQITVEAAIAKLSSDFVG
jgi:hypothetical protein